ncbi:hydroxylase [Bradyrhizobium sp. CSA207]|uniref:FAD-dependent monooxygenase n=1 Tax=Bradyrhizobium sp. CSA207 TaxID=2698826 RepID=UPI0023B00E7A|nr:FAD-dependent monooxygenase [Bradyrhizobium sp. CSA207]MDE5444337.1 hydroxylase [Bradyrhizobium sp. CSA207]
MKSIIVGAGIAGSTLALGMDKAGLDYLLLEQAPAFGEVGAGIQLSPNAVRILSWLGLGEDLQRVCAEPDFHKYSVWDTGETVLRVALKPQVQEIYGHPYYHAYRPDLIDAITRRLDRKRVKMKQKVKAVGQGLSGAWVICENGDKYEADVLIGADGIHSVVREQIFQPEPPRASGYVSWRGVVDAEDIADLDIPISAYIDMGPNLSFVYYYISAGRKFNWLATGPTDGKKLESWSQTASREEILGAFKGWYDRPARVIEKTKEIFVTGMCDRNPLESWVQGGITLMGDAAHAMLPYHASGAGQGIEDAWVLARCLQIGASDPKAALKRYEDLRIDRANRMVRHSREAEGWYHLADAEKVARRNARFRKKNVEFGDRITPEQHWLYSYDAEKAVLGADDEWRSLPAW